MSRQPNILLLFTDQQRADTIAALGNPVIRTPHLDRLAGQGVAFTSAYSPSPVCVPARCSLTFGQYPGRTGCADNGDPYPANRPGFVELLRRAGYRTHGIGKCHFCPIDARHGFESRESQEELFRRDEVDYGRWLVAQEHGAVVDPMGTRGEMYYIPQVSSLPAAAHPTQWIGDRCVNFIRQQVGTKQPWYLFGSFIHPHPPFAPPQPWHKLYRAPLMPLPHMPPQMEALHTWVNCWQNRYKYRDQGLDLNLLRNIKAQYYACISFIDFQVGGILAALEQTGQLDNTLILFSSDHGELLGDYGCFGKRSFHDACARIPLLAWQPGRLAGGARIAAPASLVDLAPTALVAAGLDPAALDGDGVDLTALAAGAVRREVVFSQYQTGGRAIYTAVTARHKYAWSAGDDREFLFDRVEDPTESRNRAGVSLCRSHLTRMRALTIAELRRQGVTEALDGDGWRRFPLQTLSPDPDEGLLIQDPPDLRLDLPGYTN